MHSVGVDVGGSGCRIAVVDLDTGRIEGEIVRLPHDQHASAASVLTGLGDALMRMPDLPVGLGFPGLVLGTEVQSAPNLHTTWPGLDLASALARPTLVLLNDADAAASAEARVGASKGCSGTVLMVTVGTGLGSGIHRDGSLVPGFELGLLPHPTRGGRLEDHASGRARNREGLDLAAWSDRFNEALAVMESEVDPDLIVIGGGITEHWARFEAGLNATAPIRKATFGAHAGLVGAALMAKEDLNA